MAQRGADRIPIGGALACFWPLVGPVFPVFGSTVRTLGTVRKDEETPPTFEDWSGSLVDGVEASVVGFLYDVGGPSRARPPSDQAGLASERADTVDESAACAGRPNSWEPVNMFKCKPFVVAGHGSNR